MAEDLSGRVPGLSISSMSAGNTVADDPGLSMTAPGTPSVLPVPEAKDRLPQPEPVTHDRTVITDVHGRKGATTPDQSPVRTAGAYQQGPPGPWGSAKERSEP